MRFSRLSPWRSAWAWPIGLGLLFLTLSPGRIIAFDVAVRTQIAHALWSHATPFVDESNATATGMVKVEGKGLTSFYGIGQSLALVPFDILGSALGALSGLSGKLRASLETLPIVWLYGPLAGILWWWALATVLREWGVSRNASRRFAALFLLATIAGVYAATTVQEEAAVGALVTAAFAAMMRWCKRGRDRDGLLVGLFLGSALLFRLNAVFAFLPIAGYAIDERPEPLRAARGVLAAAVGALPPLILFALFSHWRFGSWFATGYDLAVHQGLGVQWTKVRPALAFVLLFGLGKGILLLSPPAWLAMLGGARMLTRRPQFVIATALAFLLAALLCSRIIFNPDGSECWSVRYLVHLLGFLAYPAWLGARALKRPRVVSALFGLGFLLQLMAAAAPDTLEYQQAFRLSSDRYVLIEQVRNGQMPLRARNLAQWLTRLRPAEPRSPEIDRVTQDFLPNVWGVTYARKMRDSRWLPTLCLGAWFLLASLTMAWLAALFHPRAVAGARSRETQTTPAPFFRKAV